MKIDRQPRPARGLRFSIHRDGAEVARAYLYLMTNDLHEAPFGLMEDVFVAESERRFPFCQDSSQVMHIRPFLPQ